MSPQPQYIATAVTEKTTNSRHHFYIMNLLLVYPVFKDPCCVISYIIVLIFPSEDFSCLPDKSICSNTTGNIEDNMR